MNDKKLFLVVFLFLFAYLFTTLTFPTATSWRSSSISEPVKGVGAVREKDPSNGLMPASPEHREESKLSQEVMAELVAGLEQDVLEKKANSVSEAESSQEVKPFSESSEEHNNEKSNGSGSNQLNPEEVVIKVMDNAREAITDLYEDSQIIEYSTGKLALRHPELTSRQQVSEYISQYFGQPVLGLMNLFMIRNTSDSQYTLVRYKGMTDILTAEVESAHVTSATNNKVVVLAQLTDGGEHWGDVKVRYTISKDRADKWKITGVTVLNN